MGVIALLAWRYFVTHRLRTALTAAAISLGVGTMLAAAIVCQAAGRQAGELSAQGAMSNTLLVQAGLLLTGGLLLLASGFIILNAFGMSLAQRTREIGLLRAAGMTRGQARSLVLSEAALLGLAGAAGGLLLGLALSTWILTASGALRQTVFEPPGWTLVCAPLTGLAVTLIGALQPARHAGRVPPVAAIRPSAQIEAAHTFGRGGRLGAGLLIGAVGAAAAAGLIGRPDVTLAIPVTLALQGLLLAGAVPVVPWLLEPLARAWEPLLVRFIGPAGRIAAGNLSRHRLRAALTAGAMAAGLVAIVANSALMTSGLKGSLLRLGAMLHEDAFILKGTGNPFETGDLTVDGFFQFISSGDPRYSLDEAVTALQPLVDAGIVRVERNRFLPVPGELVALPGSPAVAVDPDVFFDIGNFVFYEGDRLGAAELMRQGGAVLLQPLVARRLNVHAGARITVQTAAGPAELTVAGVGGSGWNMPVISFNDAAAMQPGGPSHLGIVSVSRDEAGVAAALQQVRHAVSAVGATVYDYDNNLAPLVVIVSRLEAVLNGLLLLAVVVSALGVVNSVTANAVERRREIGVLRAVGATQRQVRAAVVVEAALLGALAAAVASALGLLMLLIWALLVLPNGTSSLGVRADWQTVRMILGPGLRDWALASAAASLGGPMVAAAAAYWPARSAASASIMAATRNE